MESTISGKSTFDRSFPVLGAVCRHRLWQAARIALGKFEVILRQDCLNTDLALLRPYLGPDEEAAYRRERNMYCWEFQCSVPCVQLGHRAVDRRAQSARGFTFDTHPLP